MRFLIIVLTTLYSTIVPGQSSISGQLVDNTTTEPLGFATVAIYSEKDSTLVSGTISQVNGFFKINDLSQGKYYLQARFMGYESHTISSVTLQKNQGLELEPILLMPNQQMLQEIEITGEKVTMISKISTFLEGGFE